MGSNKTMGTEKAPVLVGGRDKDDDTLTSEEEMEGSKVPLQTNEVRKDVSDTTEDVEGSKLPLQTNEVRKDVSDTTEDVEGSKAPPQTNEVRKDVTDTIANPIEGIELSSPMLVSTNGQEPSPLASADASAPTSPFTLSWVPLISGNFGEDNGTMPPPKKEVMLNVQLKLDFDGLGRQYGRSSSSISSEDNGYENNLVKVVGCTVTIQGTNENVPVSVFGSEFSGSILKPKTKTRRAAKTYGRRIQPHRKSREGRKDNIKALQQKEEFTQESFDIQQILERRAGEGGMEYLIRWEGYDASEDSWVPEKYVNAPLLIEAFEKMNSGPHEDITDQGVAKNET